MKNKVFVKGIAMVLLVALSTFGVSAFAQAELPKCYGISADGEITPYTYFIASVSTQAYVVSSSAVGYSLTMTTTRNVTLGYMHATLQRYQNGGWVDASPTRYYIASNTNYFSFEDTIYDMPAGQYRVVVDYNAKSGGLSDYFYDESGYVYL